uniref:phosphopyruvate hydratase n=1 Tax=Pyramimonas obovata TaxID=1411642 RepID=A0A7S0RFK0_9CHLO|mmetsp:Transcript_33060/g.72082  ORF Transcript_33060/g.72082 Transcript_33060/m.72082 type:complete len:496 (+) Transcript_33060:418-1905(+)
MVGQDVRARDLPRVPLDAYLDMHRVNQVVQRAMSETALAREEIPEAGLYKHILQATPPVIKQLRGRVIYDCRGNPAVEAEVVTAKGKFRASAPSGAMPPGRYEAFELRDKVPSQFHGKGVQRAIKHINEVIAPAIVGMNPSYQQEIDDIMTQMLDGTGNLSKLGANTILSVSMAVCKAGAVECALPLYRYIGEMVGNSQFVLPVPAFNVINGGLLASNHLSVKEFLILPVGANSFTEAMRMGTEVYHHLKALIKVKYGQDAINVGDEGGFTPPLNDNSDALDLIVDAIDKAGYTGKVRISLDIAATSMLTEDGTYDMDFKKYSGMATRTGDEMIALYEEYCERYPIVSIEDPFHQDDFENTSNFTALGLCQVVGDELLASRPQRVAAAAQAKVCNALLLKMNQVGTISEALQAAYLAKEARWDIVAGHRSGESEDPFLADLAVGLACGQIKAGAPCRSERLAKYNQLLRIEEDLGKAAVFANGANYRSMPYTKRT